MPQLAGMTRWESDICTGYWTPIHGSMDMDHDQAALDLVRTQLGEDPSEAARQFVAQQQAHIDALRRLQTR
jgi:hypothetical protein